MGALTEWVCEKIPSRPAILFNAIPGYPPDYRVVVNYLNSLSKVAYTVGLAPDLSARDFVELWRQRVGQIPSIPPVVRRDGPVMERMLSGDEINLLEFPGPLWHERDGGRYLGTGHVVVSQDPDGGWVNLGAYRAMTHDEKTIGLYISPGHHGRIHRDKYHARNQPMPVVMSLGHDPLLSLVGSMSVPYGVSEFDFAGGIREEPVEVIHGEITGLPFPATSEMVIEGECFPGEARQEGPFGEWTGYYGSSTRPEPFVRVRRIYARKDPIIMGAPPFRPALGGSYHGTAFRSAQIWNELEAAGVPDVRGVWSPEATGRLMSFVSIRQRYPGHARQAALVASQCHAAAYMSRFIVVFDEDVDIFDVNDALWAIATRVDPETSVEILRRCWSGPLDPIIPAEKKGFNSKMIIDACRPYEWRDKFPAVVCSDPKLLGEMERKWGELFLTKTSR